MNMYGALAIVLGCSVLIFLTFLVSYKANEMRQLADPNYTTPLSKHARSRLGMGSAFISPQKGKTPGGLDSYSLKFEGLNIPQKKDTKQEFPHLFSVAKKLDFSDSK